MAVANELVFVPVYKRALIGLSYDYPDLCTFCSGLTRHLILERKEVDFKCYQHVGTKPCCAHCRLQLKLETI